MPFLLLLVIMLFYLRLSTAYTHYDLSAKEGGTKAAALGLNAGVCCGTNAGAATLIFDAPRVGTAALLILPAGIGDTFCCSGR